MSPDQRLQLSLLLLRLSVFLVMLIWTIDKFVNPQHAIGVYEKFYFLGGVGTGAIKAIAAAELLLIAGFVAGFARTWTYGFVLALHAVSTLSSFRQYLAPFEGPNLLFFAAWPMLAACVVLFLLREDDRILTVGR
jgi:putative oxidoreductase